MALQDRLQQLIDRLNPQPSALGGANLPPGTTLPLSDRLGIGRLSDDGLRFELERRRRARGRQAHGRPAADDELGAMAQARRDRSRERSLAKCAALLEISLSASRAEVARAYRTQLRQYHPDRHLGDAEAHASAVALATSLTDAYLSLLAQFDRR